MTKSTQKSKSQFDRQTITDLIYTRVHQWQTALKLNHWRIKLSETVPAQGNYMEVAIVPSRNHAAIRLSTKAWADYGQDRFWQALMHEMVHLILCPSLHEHRKQIQLLHSEREEEYLERYQLEHEKSVEHLSHILYSQFY